MAKKKKKTEDFQETLSKEELKDLVDKAEATIETAIKNRDEAKLNLAANQDILISRVNELSNESFQLDASQKVLYKMASQKIHFDIKEVYKVLMRNGSYKGNGTVLVNYFPNEEAKRKQVEELKSKSDEFFDELQELQVAYEKSEDLIIKEKRNHKILCARLEAVESAELLAASKTVEPTVDDPILSTDQPTTEVSVILSSDGDYKSVTDDKSLWERFVEFIYKLKDNFLAKLKKTQA